MLKDWIKQNWMQIGAIVLIFLFGAYFVFQEYVIKERKEYDVFVVESTDLTYEVSISGSVVPKEKVDLAFEESGKIARIDVNVSDRVKKGDILAQLKNDEVSATLDEARKQVESGFAQLEQFRAEAQTEGFTLDEIKRGTREEEIRLARTKVSTAENELSEAQEQLEKVTNQGQITLNNLYATVDDLLQDAYTAGYDAVYRQAALVFDNEASDPKLNFITKKSQAKFSAENQFAVVADVLEMFNSRLNTLSSDGQQREQLLSDARLYLLEIRSFITTINEALIFAADLTDTELDTYKAAMNTAWENVNDEVSSVTSLMNSIQQQKTDNDQSVSRAEIDVANKETALSLARDELSLKEAGATQEELRAQEQRFLEKQFKVQSQLSNISALQSKVSQIGSRLDRFVIAAPFDGVITRQDATQGEAVTNNEEIISMISDELLEIEVFVPEIEIALLSIGDSATLTLDAYGAHIEFLATITEIDPAETLRDGVPTYKVVLQFDEFDERIKPGMTANVVIQTKKKESSLAIPVSAVMQSSRNQSQVLLEGEIAQEVKVGRISKEGLIEIVDGLEGGQRVLIEK